LFLSTFNVFENGLLFVLSPKEILLIFAEFGTCPENFDFTPLKAPMILTCIAKNRKPLLTISEILNIIS